MKSRSVAIFVPLLTVVALLTGCTGASSGYSSDPAALVKQSGDTTARQASAHLKFTVAGQVVGLPVEAIEADLTQKPAVAAKGTLDMTYLGQHLKGVAFVVVGGELWASITPGGKPSNFGSAAKIYDVAAILSPDAGLSNLLANFSESTAAGTETIAGVAVTRITGKITADAVNKILPAVDATAPVPGTVWVATGGAHELMQAQIEPSTGNTVTLTLTKWGEPVTIDTPAG
ncbi:MAG TPA: LppX_LprAFG lipoprotein [Candidatus Lumbricidophila sp.]|nr:LppX_LprAFG lipoprotein [Candidatus Lumbricidophila sp.]